MKKYFVHGKELIDEINDNGFDKALSMLEDFLFSVSIFDSDNPESIFDVLDNQSLHHSWMEITEDQFDKITEKEKDIW